MEQGGLRGRRQAGRAICAGGELDRCPQPLKQGRIEAAVQGSETLPMRSRRRPASIGIVGEPIAFGYQGIMFRKEMRGFAKS